jgi:CelD/BcsL family acetyltransferase involved in cellulose biosynthesis
MYSVELVSDSAGFLALEDEWNDTVERAAVPHPFLRHEWLRTWWDAFGNGDEQQLHTFVVRHGGRMCAIAPLMFDSTHMFSVPVRRLRLLQNDHTPRADFIVADHPDDSYRAIWLAIRETARRWDVLQLSQLPGESTTRDAFRHIAEVDGKHTGIWASGAAPYLKLRSTWSAYRDALSPKLKQNLRNRLNRLSQFGQPALEVIADPAAICAGRDDAQRLEESGWKATEGTAIRSHPAVRRFYALLAERARACAWLRLLFLTVGGRRIAAAYAALYANRLFLLKTGYDPAFAKCSPFKVLTHFAIGHAFERGLSELDFLGDTEPWKLEWTSTTRPHDWLFVFAGTPRGRLLHPLKFQFVPTLRKCTSQLFKA